MAPATTPTTSKKKLALLVAIPLLIILALALWGTIKEKMTVNKDTRSLAAAWASRDPPKGRHKIAVKVIDIFGNDTTKVMEVKV